MPAVRDHAEPALPSCRPVEDHPVGDIRRQDDARVCGVVGVESAAVLGYCLGNLEAGVGERNERRCRGAGAD